MGQFLTAVFKLRPTQRKAAALERVRSAVEETFWSYLDGIKDDAAAVAKIENKRERRDATRKLCAGGLAAGAKARLTEYVTEGLRREIDMAVSSFIELRAKGHEASWPERDVEQATDFAGAIDQLAAAVDRPSESAARDAVARVRRAARLRWITLARERDGSIVRDEKGRLAAVLKVSWASDPRSRTAHIHAGFDPTTGEVLKQEKSKQKLVIPLECSRWHENKFLSGKATLRSSIVFRHDGDWFMAAQFEMPEAQTALTGAALGIDRGVVYPVAGAVVAHDGAVVQTLEPAGAEIGEVIRRSDERRRRQQQSRGITTFRHKELVHHSLHRIANDIVAEAVKHGAEVVVEKLDEMKAVITTARPKGARKGGWRRVLKRAQLGALEQILEYKLKLAGLPKMRQVVAAGTSQTCPACGHKAKENRPEQAVFKCVECGFDANADQNAAVIIARRGVLMRNIKKGQKLDELHKNMVTRLRARNDGGLGHRGNRAAVVVPTHAAGGIANEDAVCPATLPPGQEVTRVGKNPLVGVLAERSDASSGGRDDGNSGRFKDIPDIGSRRPEDAG